LSRKLQFNSICAQISSLSRSRVLLALLVSAILKGAACFMHATTNSVRVALTLLKLVPKTIKTLPGAAPEGLHNSITIYTYSHTLCTESVWPKMRKSTDLLLDYFMHGCDRKFEYSAGEIHSEFDCGFHSVRPGLGCGIRAKSQPYEMTTQNYQLEGGSGFC
jgi:hypothetical protein